MTSGLLLPQVDPHGLSLRGYTVFTERRMGAYWCTWTQIVAHGCALNARINSWITNLPINVHCISMFPAAACPFIGILVCWSLLTFLIWGPRHVDMSHPQKLLAHSSSTTASWLWLHVHAVKAKMPLLLSANAYLCSHALQFVSMHQHACACTAVHVRVYSMSLWLILLQCRHQFGNNEISVFVNDCSGEF